MIKWRFFGLACMSVLVIGIFVQLAWDNRQLRDENRRLLAATQQLAKQEAATTANNHALANDVKTLKTRLAQKATARPGAASDDPASAEAKTDKKDPGVLGKMAGMMQDPKMRDAMRAQQKFVLGQLYGPLFKKLQLTPEELDQFKEILADKQMAGLAMLGPNDAKTKLAALLDARKQTELAMKELLDEDQYKLCQDYEATIGERTALNQINQAFTEQAMTLDDAQQEELITLMVEERGKLKIPTPNEQQEAWANGMPSDATLEKLFQQQETLNARVYERSGEILSDPQRNALKVQQDNQLQMQKAGIQMFKRLMSGDKKE